MLRRSDAPSEVHDIGRPEMIKSTPTPVVLAGDFDFMDHFNVALATSADVSMVDAPPDTTPVAAASGKAKTRRRV